MGGTPVAQSGERWICDWKVVGSNPGLYGPCWIISKVFAPYVIPVFQMRHEN